MNFLDVQIVIKQKTHNFRSGFLFAEKEGLFSKFPQSPHFTIKLQTATAVFLFHFIPLAKLRFGHS